MRALPSRPADWLVRQVRAAWSQEGDPPEAGFRLGRPVVILCGAVSLLLLATATLTVVSLDTLWRYHEGAGFVLLPVLAVKLVPIGVRASAYYWRALVGRLRRSLPRGGITPPVAIARVAAPPLVAATALLLGSGIVMWHTGDQRSAWSTVHNASAVVGGILLAIHLACHVRSTLALGVRGLGAPGGRRTGGAVPPMMVAASLMAGVILAVFTVPGASWNPGRGDRQRGPEGSGGARAVVPASPVQPGVSPRVRTDAFEPLLVRDQTVKARSSRSR